MSFFSRFSRQIQISEATAALVDSLRLGDGWLLSEHHLKNAKAKVSIWTSNKDYGLYVDSEDGKWVPNGVEREAIWAAAKDLIDARGHLAARKMTERLLKQV